MIESAREEKKKFKIHLNVIPHLLNLVSYFRQRTEYICKCYECQDLIPNKARLLMK